MPLYYKRKLCSPSPHESMILSIESSQVSEDIIITAGTLLTLHCIRIVIPGVVDHHSSIMKADAQHKRIVQDPVDHALHLLLPVLHQLSPGHLEISPARETSVKIFIIDIVSGVQSITIRVERGNNVYISGVDQVLDSVIGGIVVSEVSDKEIKTI